MLKCNCDTVSTQEVEHEQLIQQCVTQEAFRCCRSPEFWKRSEPEHTMTVVRLVKRRKIDLKPKNMTICQQLY